MNLPDYDIVATLIQLKEELQSGKVSQVINSRYILLDIVLHYLSKADSDIAIQLYIPQHLRNEVIEQYHDNNGHMEIDKAHDAIKTKYYRPNMYEDLYQYVTFHETCQTRNLIKSNLFKTDAPTH